MSDEYTIQVQMTPNMEVAQSMRYPLRSNGVDVGYISEYNTKTGQGKAVVSLNLRLKQLSSITVSMGKHLHSVKVIGLDFSPVHPAQPRIVDLNKIPLKELQEELQRRKEQEREMREQAEVERIRSYKPTSFSTYLGGDDRGAVCELLFFNASGKISSATQNFSTQEEADRFISMYFFDLSKE